MEKDVVCGMEIDPKKAGAQSEFQGQDFYFCGPDCKDKFEENPELYARKQEKKTAQRT